MFFSVSVCSPHWRAIQPGHAVSRFHLERFPRPSPNSTRKRNDRFPALHNGVASLFAYSPVTIESAVKVRAPISSLSIPKFPPCLNPSCRLICVAERPDAGRICNSDRGMVMSVAMFQAQPRACHPKTRRAPNQGDSGPRGLSLGFEPGV